MNVVVANSPSAELPTNDSITSNQAIEAENCNEETLLLQLNATQQMRKRIPRKRRHSVAEDSTSGQPSSTKPHAGKHRRQYSAHNKKGYVGDIILPTNFLLGGNISDPLNLNSLLDEKVNKAFNAVTPSSSPLPPRSSKISIVIPNDMTDPLGLNLSQTDQRIQNDQNKPNHKKKKKRRKSQHEKLFTELHQDRSSTTTPDKKSTNSQKENIKSKNRRSNSKLLNIEDDVKAATETCTANLTITVPKISSTIVDPIVSPVVPQDVKRSSAVFSPKMKKRKSVSQGSAKKASQSNVNSSQVSKDSIHHEKSKSENDSDNLTDKLFSEIKAVRLQTTVKSTVSVPSDDKQDNKTAKPKSAVSFKPSNARFQYGNYTQYYGYRNPRKFQDVRLNCLKKDWFKDKDVLDVGCNVGHFTLLIARNFSPRKIVGIDIDDNLINNARKNVRHYATAETKPPLKGNKYPDSMSLIYGPIIAPPVDAVKEDKVTFPNNVVFLQGNYVPEKDEVLQYQEPEYDVIVCMSVTKWIHLNWGDEGLINTFKRFYKQLRPGGKLILEPQEWKSYAKKKSKLTQTIYDNFYSIKLKPNAFPRYLVDEIGFEKVEYLNKPESNAKGFQRPIQLYSKPE